MSAKTKLEQKDKAVRSKRVITMFGLLLALCAAVYLNWRFADTMPIIAGKQDEEENEENDGRSDYGDTLFVSANIANIDEYFAQARLARSRSRDESLSALQTALANTDLSETEKSNLTAKLTAEARSISLETATESLIKSKGFYDCVVFLSGDSVRIVVAAPESGLSEAQVAQLMDIAISQTGVVPSNISIVEVK